MSTIPSTVISPDRQILTLINTFVVSPDQQQALLDLLIEATEKTMSRLPGFLAANFHKSLDGRSIANYAQWASNEHFDAMLANPEAQEHMRAAEKIADSISPIRYQVVYVTGPAVSEKNSTTTLEKP
jgi:quinol monooxygenase YgiN